MSNVIIVATMVTLKGSVVRTFLEIMFFLRRIHSEHPFLLGYVEGVAKAGFGLINAGQ